MSDKDSKNIVDSATPQSPEIAEKSETEKKQMELGGQMEHEQGAKREELESEIEDLEGK